MGFRTSRSLLAVLLLMGSLAGCASGGGGHDVPVPGEDSGTDMMMNPVGESDAGEDAGHPQPMHDAGHPHMSMDAGHDAGMPEHDAGMMVMDAGMPEEDGGHDAGPAALPGMSWPTDQIFPSFAAPAELDVVDSDGMAADVLTMTVALQGLVNREQPRIYVLTGGGEPKTMWLDRLGAKTNMVSDPLSLVIKYRSEITGLVITDDNLKDTVNLATTLAGLKSTLVASPALATKLMAAPYNVPMVSDLRANHFASSQAMYQWQFDRYGAQASHRLIIGLDPGIAGNLRDYAVATQAMVVWLDPRNGGEKTLLKSYLALLPANSPYLGWWKDEPTGVSAAASSGVPVYAADWSANLTVLGGSARTPVKTPFVPPPPELENKLYVAIFMSDGDNIQEDQHLVPLKWADANRGKVPIGWTLNPALVDVAPTILHYFQENQSPNDVLVSGPSGLGYTYPAAWPAGVFDSYAAVSGKYIDAAGFRVITVWNNGADLSDGDAHSYQTHMPNLVGMTIQDESRAYQRIDGRLPVVKLNISYGDNEGVLEGGIDNVLHDYRETAPSFAVVQGNMNSGSITPTAFFNVMNHYANNNDVVFVRPDHFMQLVEKAKWPARHAFYNGDFTGDGKTDLMFYYADDHRWWMGVSNGAGFDWHMASMETTIGDLLDGKHVTFTGDFTGDGKVDILAHGNADSKWWLGASDGAALTWTMVNNSGGFGNLLDGSHAIYQGDFNGDKIQDVMFHYNGDHNWWLGTSDGKSLTWSLAADTDSFGNLFDGAHRVYIDDYTGDGKADVMMYGTGDGHFWLGTSDGKKLTFSDANDSHGFGNLLDASHAFFRGDFDGDGKGDFLFYNSVDQYWWKGLCNGTTLTWSTAGQILSLGNPNGLGRRVLVADYDGDHKSDLAMYDAASDTWWRGTFNGANIGWQAGAVAGHGDVIDTKHALFSGDYDGDGKADALSYGSADGLLFQGGSSAGDFSWKAAGDIHGYGDLLH